MTELALLVLIAPAAFARHPLMDDYRAAWQLVGQRDTQQSIPALKSLIERDPHFLPAYRSLAEAFAQVKEWAEGNAYFMKLASSDPHNGLPYYAIGQLWTLRENIRNAAKSYSNLTRR